jgi:hypothetical protein
MDARAAHGVGGDMGATWVTIEVVGAARGMTEFGEAGDEGAAQGLVV